MKKEFWIAAALAVFAGAAAHAAPAVQVPDAMVTPVKVVKHTHRTVTRKTTTTRRVVHRHTTTSATSASANGTPNR